MHLRPLELGEDGVTGVAVSVRCIRCASPLRAVTLSSSRGLADRERRIMFACTRSVCGWEGHVRVELVDAGIPEPITEGP